MASRYPAIGSVGISVEPSTYSSGWRAILAIAFIVALASEMSTSFDRLLDRALETSVPDVAPISVYDVFVDSTPVTTTFTAAWWKVTATVTAEALRNDPTTWRMMHFDDWDAVPTPLREQALENMWVKHTHLIQSPRSWDRMDAADWDLVPQPIRAMAFIQMIRYWSGHYQTGSSFGVPRRLVTDTMTAIVMVESWFEHRAVSTSVSGNRDLGLGQASDGARLSLRRLHEGGVIDFAPEDESEYFNPWIATRAVAVWFGLMLEENDGDLDAAVRAYHRGTPLARNGEGDVYAANVYSKRRQFMRNDGTSPTWHFLFVRSYPSPRTHPSDS
jgi:hypothetical protein